MNKEKSYSLNPELEEEMRSIQSKHTEESPYTGIIDEYLNTPIPEQLG